MEVVYTVCMVSLLVYRYIMVILYVHVVCVYRYTVILYVPVVCMHVNGDIGQGVTTENRSKGSNQHHLTRANS